MQLSENYQSSQQPNEQGIIILIAQTKKLRPERLPLALSHVTKQWLKASDLPASHLQSCSVSESSWELPVC